MFKNHPGLEAAPILGISEARADEEAAASKRMVIYAFSAQINLFTSFFLKLTVKVRLHVTCAREKHSYEIGMCDQECALHACALNQSNVRV